VEGCLSFPNLYGMVRRYLVIEAEWMEIFKKKLIKKKSELSGFEAIVFQHEVDHLEGILFVDHIKEDGGKLYLIKGKEKVEKDVGALLAKAR
jgi:peptide deformylase